MQCATLSSLFISTYIFHWSIVHGQREDSIEKNHRVLKNDNSSHYDAIFQSSKREDNDRPNDDDEDWLIYRQRKLAEAMIRLNNASSLEDIIGLGFVNNDGHPLTLEDFPTSKDELTGKVVISDEAKFATADTCSPKETSLAMNTSGIPADTIVYPKCIKVKMCGGCCNVANVKCEPFAVERSIVNLVKLKFSVHDDSMQMAGLHPVQVVQHKACWCRCTLTEELCGPYRIFDKSSCSCQCRNLQKRRCDPPYFYNPETCNCECAERIDCCPHNKDCPLRFADATCQCEIGKMIISSNTNATTNNSDIPNENGHSGGKSQHSSTPSSETTSVTIDSCSQIICPLRFIKKVNSQGRCTCFPKLPYGNSRIRR